MKKPLLSFCMAVFCVFTAIAQESNDSTIIEEPSFDNPVIKAIMARRSIRKYLDKPVEHEKLAVIAECGINAPSSGNNQPWLLRVVENQELLAEINQVYVKAHAQQVRRDKNFKKYDMIQIPNPEEPVFICLKNYNAETGEYKTKILNDTGDELFTNFYRVEAINISEPFRRKYISSKCIKI